MKRCLLPILILSLLVSSLLLSCGAGLQTFSKHDISFKVANSLKLEEYILNSRDQTLRKGSTSYDQGWVMSNEKNFVFLWIKRPEMTAEEVRLSILTTPNVFQSASGTFKAEISGGLVTEQIAGFDVTFALMQFKFLGGEGPGLTALWYCSASGRVMQLIIINKQPEGEMKRFIRSFSCAPHE